MMDIQTSMRKYQAAAFLFFLSALFHLPVLILDFTTYGISMLVTVATWVLLGYGLMRGMRGVAYLAFIALLFGLVVALGSAMNAIGIVAICFWLIFIIELLAAFVLFRILWANRAQPAN